MQPTSAAFPYGTYHTTHYLMCEENTMAEVMPYWPEGRTRETKKMEYPWKHWQDGRIWLATQGIDFHASSGIYQFRSNLYTRAKNVTTRRKRWAERLTPEGRKVRYTPLHVKVQIVANNQVAFQFYDGHHPDETPEPPLDSAIPKRLPTRAKRLGGAAALDAPGKY